MLHFVRTHCHKFQRKLGETLCDKINRGLLDGMADEPYLRLVWRLKMGYTLDLENPRTFNEKLQWLKLYDRKSIYTVMADKYKAKEYFAGIIGDEYLIPTLGCWSRFDDIDFSTLPDSFVLKTNHDNAGVVIVKDKACFDRRAAKRKLERHLKVNFYYRWREWCYKDIEPVIMAEELLENTDRSALVDYKFFCFNGEPLCSYAYIRAREYPGHLLTNYDGSAPFKSIDLAKNHGLKTFYDSNYELMPFASACEPAIAGGVLKPDNLELMRELARKLSAGIPHVRVDFFEAGGKVYVGECTLYTGGGMNDFRPDKYDLLLGNMLELPSREAH